MTKLIAGLLLLAMNCPSYGQDNSVIDQAVEGGKVLVELIKVIGRDKDKSTNSGCKGRHADLCITNARDSSLTVAMTHRTSNETRELVIIPEGQECSLHMQIGVWTYELKLLGSLAILRKGDLLIEACDDMAMSVK